MLVEALLEEPLVLGAHAVGQARGGGGFLPRREGRGGSGHLAHGGGTQPPSRGVRSARRPSLAVVCERLPRGVASLACTIPPSSSTASPVASWPLGSSWNRSSCARWNASVPPGPSRAVTSSSEQPAVSLPRQVQDLQGPVGEREGLFGCGCPQLGRVETPARLVHLESAEPSREGPQRSVLDGASRLLRALEIALEGRQQGLPGPRWARSQRARARRPRAPQRGGGA